MKNRTAARLIVSATLAGLPLVAGLAFGQVRQNTGHATDANPRVGSGGYNDNPTSPGNAAINNAITTGNATGLFSFSGANVNGVNLGVGYTDPFAFRGLLAGQGVDQFIAASAGVPTMANPTASSQTYAPVPRRIMDRPPRSVRFRRITCVSRAPKRTFPLRRQPLTPKICAWESTSTCRKITGFPRRAMS